MSLTACTSRRNACDSPIGTGCRWRPAPSMGHLLYVSCHWHARLDRRRERHGRVVTLARDRQPLAQPPMGVVVHGNRGDYECAVRVACASELGCHRPGTGTIYGGGALWPPLP